MDSFLADNVEKNLANGKSLASVTMNSSNVSSGSNTEPKRKRSYNNQNHHHKVKSHCLGSGNGYWASH